MTQTMPAPVNVIVGKEGLLIDRARLAIIAAVRRAAATPGDPDGRSVPITDLRGGDVTTTELVELLSPSLFGEDRIVVLTDCDAAGKEPADLIVQAAADPAPGITLILQHSGEGRQKKMVAALRKTGAQLFEAHAMKRSALPSFVRGEFQAHRLRVSQDVIDALLDSVGSDLRELATAVSQLVSDTGGNVTVDAVRTYYGRTAEVSGFEVAELALTGRGPEALALARRAMQIGVPHVLLASALSGMVGDVARLHAVRGVSNRDAGTYGMPPWKLEKTHRLASRWSTPAIAHAAQIIAELDAGVKGWAADPEYAVEKAVVDIAALARGSHRR
ncbi:DNA polymerase III subunit delta [Corynebacterium freneyi]|uniref:DNA polymerase III subunit delta n=1 Tax=Corynebacterium freneyi TaxID=134034 RepID=UPI00396C9107